MFNCFPDAAHDAGPPGPISYLYSTATIKALLDL